jgi:phenylpropionate dioxygenase-like ring-hydroxylating dioxygenase large terminal subunit
MPTAMQETTQEVAVEGGGFEPDAEPPRSLPILAGSSKGAAMALKPRASVARPLRHWYILAMSAELGARPIARTLFGMPLVLFRDGEGKPGALLDRCAHRNVPLSPGSVENGCLQCPYHGWRYDAEGVCRFVPSLAGPSEGKARRVPAFAAREEDGFVWVYATPNEKPVNDPHRFALTSERGYTTVRRMVEAKGTMHATLENALDVPHTAFLHRGLFRSESRGITITAQVHRTADRVEAEYLGEPRPPGIVARILSPSGGMVTHFDRFILPSIAQVEYRIGTENHFLVDSVMTPVSDFVTRVFAVVSFRVRLLPGWLLKPFLMPLALRVFRQDARILEMQTDVIHRFGGEQFASTEIDVMGRHIWRLLKAAERGDTAGEERGEVKLVV